MSWAEIKKAVNSDLSTPLNELIESVNGITPTTQEMRDALALNGFEEKETITLFDNTTLRMYVKTGSITSTTWDKAKKIANEFYKNINNWSREQGYGDICLYSRLPSVGDTLQWLLDATSSNAWAETFTGFGSSFPDYGSAHMIDKSNSRWSRATIDKSLAVIPIIYTL